MSLQGQNAELRQNVPLKRSTLGSNSVSIPNTVQGRSLDISWTPLINRKIILLATSTIQNDTLFVNGLFQNVHILYKLFESIGYAPILLVNSKPTHISDVPPILRSSRMITIDDLAKSPMPIHLYLEVGMSTSPDIRKLLKIGGARIVKLYLGNILNIDSETIMFYPTMDFSHHVVGELDEIWVSPHYQQHQEYAAILNHVEPNDKQLKIAPYVWDPCILTKNGTRHLRWRPRTVDEPEAFIILEPNISFQKSAFLAILIIEKYYRETKNPIRVLIGNSDHLKNNTFFIQTVLSTLLLYKDSRITFSGRNDILDIMADYPYATAVLHHWNNQYNYMLLEYLYCGFPVIHNAPDWSDAGYYYKDNNIDSGKEALYRSVIEHPTSTERYRATTEAVRWRHSPYNPEIQKAWKKMVECGVKAQCAFKTEHSGSN